MSLKQLVTSLQLLLSASLILTSIIPQNHYTSQLSWLSTRPPPVISLRPNRKVADAAKWEAIPLHLLPRPEGATEEWFTPFPSKINQEWSEKHGPKADFDPTCHSNEFTKVGPGVFLRFSNRRAAHAVGILIAEFTDSDDLLNYNRIDAEAQGYILFDWRSLEPYPQSPPISATDKPTEFSLLSDPEWDDQFKIEKRGDQAKAKLSRS
ncbi:hypothetical protein C8J56DRAFT_885952 [Mycena floridula]|nr:hypothetical protein C8J56DRAFT_885952 [Mycena floridula]